MAPKKGQKMSLNAFFQDSSLGSWADEMDALPSAPAQKTDEERARMNERGFDRRDRDFGARPDRAQPQREELPLPTEPPYTAFVGNLPFDLTEDELKDFFTPLEAKSVKIIRDRDEKPKGFGYVEFEDLDGLKDALGRTGSTFQNRAIRISVAAPPTQRGGAFGDDDEKFSGPWRRDGPLPDRQPSRFDGGGSKFAEDRPVSVAETNNDWRSNRPPPPPRVEESPRPPRRTGFAPERDSSAADTSDDWTIGSKFKPAPPVTESGPPRGRFGGRGDFGGPPTRREPSASEGGDWRTSMRMNRQDSQEKSPSSSGPPTPQMGRRKLELMPRSSQSNSAVSSPLSSPKMSSATATSRPNPFGAAKPVDVTARETEVAERVEKEREELAKTLADKPSLIRTTSKTPRERDSSAAASPTAVTPAPSTPASPAKAQSQSSTVRPAFSFASAAAANKQTAKSSSPGPEPDIPESVEEAPQEPEVASKAIDAVTEKVSEIIV